MPQGKAKVKATNVQGEKMIPVVDSGTLALTTIQLFSDERIMKRMRDALYSWELVEKLDNITRRLAVLTTSDKVTDDSIKTLESKLAALEHEADKVEQYSRRPNLRFTGIREIEGTTNENMTEKLLDIINEDMCPDTSAGSIPGFVRYRSIPEFCSILDTRYLRCKSNIQIEHSSQ